MYVDYSDLLTHKEAAKFKDMSPELLRYYVNGGRGPEQEIICGNVYYHKDILNAWEPEQKRLGRPKKKRNNGTSRVSHP